MEVEPNFNKRALHLPRKNQKSLASWLHNEKSHKSKLKKRPLVFERPFR